VDSKLTGNQASDFELVDTTGADAFACPATADNKNVVLVFNRSLF
jgi:peroxiredoxin